MSTESAQAAQFAWHDYVVQVNDNQPSCGWLNASQLPKLSPDDIALCLDAQRDVLDDVMVRPADLAHVLRTDGIDAAGEYIAESIMNQLRAVIRRQLLADLQIHAERCEIEAASVEATRMNLTAQQYAEHIRGTEHIR